MNATLPSSRSFFAPLPATPELTSRECAKQLRASARLVWSGSFDVVPAYDEVDGKRPRKGVKMLRGQRAYQVEKEAAHPVDGYPCRIKLAEKV
jgi:hypothetical protein